MDKPSIIKYFRVTLLLVTESEKDMDSFATFIRILNSNISHEDKFKNKNNDDN